MLSRKIILPATAGVQLLYPPAGVAEPVSPTRQLMLTHLSSLILPACQNPLARTQGLQESNTNMLGKYTILHYHPANFFREVN